MAKFRPNLVTLLPSTLKWLLFETFDVDAEKHFLSWKETEETMMLRMSMSSDWENSPIRFEVTIAHTQASIAFSRIEGAHEN